LSQVRQGDRVDQARNGSGFESESGFRDAFTKIFGESPTSARSNAPLFAERIDSPLGPMVAVADDQGLRLLEFIDRRATERELSILRKRLRTNVVPGKHRYLETVRSQLKDYFAGRKLDFDVRLAPVGSSFQLRAWKILQSIPVGETRSYSWMAKRLGDENARRAVGRANGTNMISIIIPCHRVIRADGTLCGYGGGLWRKKWLLDHERRWAKNDK
jgi:AraC family transcriptional regulator, regulatory protein of adaptative response / methylated-DNA-[protein]-cysteine methyltransferase